MRRSVRYIVALLSLLTINVIQAKSPRTVSGKVIDSLKLYL